VEEGVRTFQPAERARQLGIGLDQTMPGGIVFRAEAYDRDVRDLRTRFVNSALRIDPLSEINPHVAFIAPERARGRGVELSVERDAGRNVDWSASYVISSSTQRLNGMWVPRPTDQPRAMRGDWSFHPANNAWRMTISGIRHSGWPYTPEAIRVDTIITGQNRSIWVTRSPGELFSRRASAYQRVDARWTRFIDTRSGRVALFVDIYNLLNNTNERERYTDVLIRQSGTTFGEGSRTSLPRIPSFGINWEF
jgi:hypothetical protein